MDEKRLKLPEGVAVHWPWEPLNDMPPFNLLHSDMQSLLVFCSFALVAIIILAWLALACRSIGNKAVGWVCTGLFGLIAVATLATGITAGVTWSSHSAIQPKTISWASGYVSHWLGANSVSAGEAEVQKIVCNIYDNKSKVCPTDKSETVKVRVGGQVVEAKVLRTKNGYLQMINTKFKSNIINP